VKNTPLLRQRLQPRWYDLICLTINKRIELIMMDNYQSMLRHCEKNTRISKRVIDEFLIYYAAAKAGLDKKIDQLLKPLRHVARRVPDSAVNIFKSEYIAIQLFRKNGLLGKYIKHSEIRTLPPEDYHFLQYQLQHPWRFSYAIIKDNPAVDFYNMVDVFSSEEYLLYSPGMSQTLREMPATLWFNLINFNGQCWQTTGVIQGFQSFTPNDIFFFATEIYPDLEDEGEMLRKIEDNPWPFFMLITGSRQPQVEAAGCKVVYHSATDDVTRLPVDKLKQAFVVSWNKGVYELKSEAFSNPPHFAKAYFEESTKTLHRFAMTAQGFDQLTNELLNSGIAIDPEPLVEVGPSMMSVTEEILRRKIEVNPYEGMFASTPDADVSENTDKLNHLLEIALPFINEGKPLDVEKLAAEAGVDLDTAIQVLEQVTASVQKIRDRK
jgi:hypothetical protein